MPSAASCCMTTSTSRLQLRIEGGCRLVEQHHLRVHRQGAGDRHPLLLAAGEAHRVGVALVGEPDLVEQLLCSRDRRVLRRAANLDRRFDDVLEHGHVRPEIEVLKHHADVGTHLARGRLDGGIHRGRRDGLVVHDDASASRLLEQGEAAQEGGLAGSGWANDADDFARGDRQSHILEHLVGAKALADRVSADEFALRHRQPVCLPRRCKAWEHADPRLWC